MMQTLEVYYSTGYGTIVSIEREDGHRTWKTWNKSPIATATILVNERGCELVSGSIVNDTMTVSECGRCDGSGYIKAFSHYADGACFACKGDGKLYFKK